MSGPPRTAPLSPRRSGRGNKVLLRIPSDHPPCLTPRPRWSTAAQHPGGKLLHQPRHSRRAFHLLEQQRSGKWQHLV
uniref:Uncharacterized protein n=1 Tax=Corvus moneduloides TaxID=1196302 RepID=A0A8C3DII5_CORMO